MSTVVYKYVDYLIIGIESGQFVVPTSKLPHCCSIVTRVYVHVIYKIMYILPQPLSPMHYKFHGISNHVQHVVCGQKFSSA